MVESCDRATGASVGRAFTTGAGQAARPATARSIASSYYPVTTVAAGPHGRAMPID